MIVAIVGVATFFGAYFLLYKKDDALNTDTAEGDRTKPVSTMRISDGNIFQPDNVYMYHRYCADHVCGSLPEGMARKH